MLLRVIAFILLLSVLFVSCRKRDVIITPEIIVDSVLVNGVFIPDGSLVRDVSIDDVAIDICFSEPVDTTMFNKDRIYLTNGVGTSYSYRFDDLSERLTIIPSAELIPLSVYRLIIDQGSNLGGTIFYSYSASFKTKLDTTPKFPKISDDSLLTLVQRQTFTYFWDYGHPVSGLSRERLGSGNLVTSGGSGFGLMAVLTAVERGFITRAEGFERLNTTVNFLINPSTDRFHGAFPHWLNGSTGEVIPFSTNDNGGDLVETAFLMQGLLTVREYFRNGSAEELAMCDSITKLWEGVEWNWYQKNGEDILYWHWSPNLGWIMNMGISGWNEALIVYLLAAASPTYPITEAVYTQGWARDGSYPMVNGKTFYDITLPLGPDYGGPLFFAHYSFLGLDPRNLSDRYASYWDQNVAHAKINHAYCLDNPKGYECYSDSCWGLTASDIPGGYSASSPANDLGVIAPTAALSSFPYTPEESMKALRFFYYIIGDKLWGDYGFYDAFNMSTGWYAGSYIAIDQGPVICMIENYRSGLLWNLFMQSAEVKAGLDKLGFTY